MKTLVFTLFFSLAISTVTYSQTFSPSPPDDDIERAISSTLFTKIDSDNDGKVSFDEVYEFRTQEARRQHEVLVNEFFDSCDANKDDKVEASELPTDPIASKKGVTRTCFASPDTMDYKDADGDGSITKKEYLDSLMGNSRPSKKAQKRLKEKQETRRKEFEREQYIRCDKDKDGYLTLREAASMYCNINTETFDVRDEDKDSLISEEEMLVEIKPIEYDYSKSGTTHYYDYSKGASSNYYDYAQGGQSADYKVSLYQSLHPKIIQCDKNENGKLDINETVDKDCEVDLADFNTADSNGDDMVDLNEINRLRMKDTFDQLDTNKDGWLDKKEFKGSRVRYL